ncbi:alpha/beta fold hydrolase [Fictibacillus terranigra]|uniref:Alpha/beta fold hydrolase n=1 Tax=Fictibacillus terranigra TaxID=3058424 RepID=A0ABT8EDQ3_9BACL|nr:alpha/beta fold hydrolase [Fictibacillus sp. CENA-BCM004]MDN4076066.1 alpha/beta fold hydrolase [Fictibacillus sp. CENA-BCM004]
MKHLDGEYYVDINNVRHWVKIEGRGVLKTIPLLIIHGGPGGNHYTFERTVYYEQRGCGRSDKPESDEAYTIPELICDFNKIIQWLGVEKVGLLGYYFGAELVMEFTYAYPQYIRKMILSAPSLISSDIGRLVQITSFMSIGDSKLSKQIHQWMIEERFDINTLYKKVWDMADTDTVDRLLFENQEVAKFNRKLWEESGLENTGLMMKTLQKCPVPCPLTDRLKAIKTPALIMTGIHDRNTGLAIYNHIRS